MVVKFAKISNLIELGAGVLWGLTITKKSKCLESFSVLFFIFQEKRFKKLWKIYFISPKTLFWFLRYLDFCKFQREVADGMVMPS